MRVLVPPTNRLPTTEMSKKTLDLTEQNMKVVFDYARKLLRAKDMQEVVQIQSEFFKSLQVTGFNRIAPLNHGSNRRHQ